MADSVVAKDGMSSSSYLTTCSKVTLDAYNRVLEQLQSIKDGEKRTEDFLTNKLRAEEDREKATKDKLKREAMATNEVVKMQMALKLERERMERAQNQVEFRTVISAMPENLINVYPRITETPADLRKSRKVQQQEELKKDLKQQMSNRAAKRVEETVKFKQEELEVVTKVQEKVKKEEELVKQRDKEKMEKYKTELNKDIKCKVMQKKNEKKLEEIEYNGMSELQHLLAQGTADNDPKKAADDIDKNQNAEPEAGQNVEANKDKEGKTEVQKPEDALSKADALSEATTNNPNADKLALILERKQRKANILLKKLEDMETASKSGMPSTQKYSLEKMKKALNPPGYKMQAEGKTVRITKEEVDQIINKGSKDDDTRSRASYLSRNKSEERFGKSPTEKAQKVAYKRYLTSLESQASEEQKRILDTLKREHDVVERIKEKEKTLREQRQLYRHLILDQITKTNQRKSQDVMHARGVPDIAGNQGYPPIYEPSPEVQKKKAMLCYKKQKDIWLQQVRKEKVTVLDTRSTR